MPSISTLGSGGTNHQSLLQSSHPQNSLEDLKSRKKTPVTALERNKLQNLKIMMFFFSKDGVLDSNFMKKKLARSV